MPKPILAGLLSVAFCATGLRAASLPTRAIIRQAPRITVAPQADLFRPMLVPRAIPLLPVPLLKLTPLPLRPAPRLSPAEALAEMAPPGDIPSSPAPRPSLLDRADLFIKSAKRHFFPQHTSPDAPAAVASKRRPTPERLPTDEEMRSEMALSPLTNPEREQAVVNLFIEAGAQRSEITLQDAGMGRHNIYVVKKGRTDKVIVVGAHHDKVEEGAGTIDNWSGTTMMINLYQEVRDLDTEATYVFIAFSREEEGLIGSQFYLDSLPRSQREKISAMINLDTMAVDGTFSVKNLSDRVLLDATRRAAAAAGLPVAEISYWGDSDSSTFRREGIKAMTLAGATPEVIFDIIHSENDTMAFFSLPHYKNAYLLSLALLKSLDRGGLAAD